MSSLLEKEGSAFRGTVKNGVVILTDVTLPEGTAVMVTLPEADVPVTMRQEFDTWDRAGNDAWNLIEQWEAEEASAPETLA